jgi:polysaccharide transporter, PST family
VSHGAFSIEHVIHLFDISSHLGQSPLRIPSLKIASSTVLGNVAPGLRKILGNMSWLMFDRIVRMGMGLFVGVWVARYLGPSQFGSLNFAISFVGIFGTVTTLGLDMIVVQEIIRGTEHVHEILGTTIALRTFASALASLAAVVTIRLIQPQDKLALLLVSITTLGVFFQSVDTIDLFFQSQVNSKLTVWAKNLAFLICAVIKVELIRSRAPLWKFAAISVAELALAALGLVISYWLSGHNLFSWRIRGKQARNLLRQSWPAIFSSMAIMIYMRIDTVMLKIMQGDTAAGLYAAVTRVSEAWYFVPVAIVSSVSPAILRAKDNPPLFYGRLRTLFFAMTWSSLLVGSIVAFSSRLIVKILFSSAYSAAAPVLAVHIWASVFVFLGVAQGPWDVSENLLKLSFYRTSSAAVINVLLNLVLIPRYSAMGAAISTVIAYSIATIFANAFSSRTRIIFFMQLKSFLPYSFYNLRDKSI